MVHDVKLTVQGRAALGCGTFILVAAFCFPAPAITSPGPAKVYYGKLDGAKKPSEVTAKKVFEIIPEYKEIVERELSKDDPEYIALLNKANIKFFDAVRKAAQKSGRDVVVEKGYAQLEGEVIDLTQKAIDSIAN